jgi:DNA-directed RNA polymerase subunit RPC12/RpoP
MGATTIRRKPIKCPYCKRKQLIHLLVVPYKPAVLIGKQTVRCVECGRVFDLRDEPKIVDGPFAD